MEHSVVIINKDEMLNSLDIVNKLNEGWDILRVDSSDGILVYIFEKLIPTKETVNLIERGVKSTGAAAALVAKEEELD